MVFSGLEVWVQEPLPDYGAGNTVKCPDCGEALVYTGDRQVWCARCDSTANLSMTTTKTKTPIHHIPTKQDEDKYTV